jgi:DNA-binding NtrC family response regulator
MPLSAQAKLLRAIQDGEFERVGGTQPIEVDVRFIATTSVALESEIHKGNFRQDLFYRLNVVPINMPPLRDRRGDIPVLIHHFIETFARETDKSPVRLTDDAIHKLSIAYWRGNVRELQNIVHRAVILASGATLDAGYFQFEDDRSEHLSKLEQTFRFGSVREMEKLMIIHRLGEHEQNRTHTAKTLDISVRTLRNKLREYRESPATHGDVVGASLEY